MKSCTLKLNKTYVQEQTYVLFINLLFAIVKPSHVDKQIIDMIRFSESNAGKLPAGLRKKENKMEKRYEFAILDPRPLPASIEANDKVFGNPKGVTGIEVTIPKLASRCVLNIDPQHTVGDIDKCAVEEALSVGLPEFGSTLATVRADLDSVGSMAIFNLRANGQVLGSGIMSRIKKIADFDKFSNGPYPGSKELPSLSNLWPEGKTGLEALNEAILDSKSPIHDRLAIMENWLLTGQIPRVYEERVNVAREKMVAAIENNEVKIKPVSIDDNYRINLVIVESSHFFATTLGYMLSPVVVAINPQFKQGVGEPYLKYTVCAYRSENADIKSALVELAQLEPGWGGSPTIGGSPQGVSSVLNIETVVGVIKRHINRV